MKGLILLYYWAASWLRRPSVFTVVGKAIKSGPIVPREVALSQFIVPADQDSCSPGPYKEFLVLGQT